MEYKDLVKLALEVKENAYVPYSGFKVGSALLTKKGNIYTGVNVESVAYSPTICAESTAIVKAVTAGEQEFSAIAIISNSVEYTMPCGVCRQRLYEFGDDFDVICANNKQEYIVYKIKELLPHGFNKESLLKG